MLTFLCSIKWIFFSSSLLTLSCSQGFYMMLIWNVPSWVANILPNSWFWNKLNCQSLLLALDCELKTSGMDILNPCTPTFLSSLFHILFPGCSFPVPSWAFSFTYMAKTLQTLPSCHLALIDIKGSFASLLQIKRNSTGLEQNQNHQ